MSTALRLIENVRIKCNIFGEALRIRVKKFTQNLPENYSKRTEIAITACKFSNFRGSMLPDPPKAFLKSQLASNLFCRKKNTLQKHVEITAPSL